MRFTVGGDAKHYTLGTNAVNTCAALQEAVRLYAGKTKSARVRTATARYRTFTTVRGDTALYNF